MRRLKNRFRSRGSRSQSPLPTTQSSLDPGTTPSSTKTSQTSPAQSITNPSTAAAHIPSSSAPLETGQNYGIKVLYDGDNASVDVVFVHGLTGNAYNTWLHRDSGVHWPQDLLKNDIADARILIFGYDADIVNFWTQASRSGISNVAEEMVRDLVRKRQQTETETRRILFVAHSLGGLVLKHALCYSRKNRVQYFDQIERHTAGIIFLGVPHCGSDLARWASFGTQIANKSLVEVLRPDSEMLRLLENDFHDILKRRTYEGSEILITCFYEELDVTGVGKIVPLHSAEIKGYGCFPIRANHMDMTRFPNSADRGYQALLGELQSWKRPAPKAVRNNSLPDTPVNVDTETSNRGGLAPPAIRSHQFGHTSGWTGQNLQGTFYGDVNFNIQTIDSSKTTNHKMAEQWMVPRSASKFYTGRATLDNRLAEAFSFKLSDTPIQQRCFVIIGIGGTGKSEVCLKFAEVHRDEYWGVFWLNASSTITAEQGYIEIGQRCGVTAPSTESVKAWLTCSKKRWLLIIDNADNPEMDCSKYISSRNRGDILITTRNRECEEYNTVGSEILDNLEPQFAQQLLLRAAGIKDIEWKKKAEAALTVVQLLGSHTLAIIQAGAFIKQRFCTFEEYPEYFQMQKRQLLEFHSKQNLSTYGNLFATFEVSTQYLQESKQLDALYFLHALAFMHNNGITEKIFQGASEYAMELRNRGPDEHETVDSFSISHITRVSKVFQCEWSNYQDRSRFRKARSILESLSIITVRDVDGSTIISMHPLIHTWAKERQDDQSQCQSWQSAATILALSCQGQYNYIAEFSMLQPHIQAYVSHDINTYTLNMSDLEAAQIYVQFAFVFYRMRDKNSLKFFFKKMHLRLQDKLPAHQDLAFLVKFLTGEVFMHEGRFEEGIQIFEELIEAMVENDIGLLDSQYNLASAYLDGGQVNNAIIILEKIVKRGENLAENDLTRLVSQYELAHIYLNQGQIDEAAKLLKQVVDIREKTLPEDYPDRLHSQHELARAYFYQGQIDEAIKILQHVVDIQKKALPENESSRLESEFFLAVAYEQNGRLDEAIKLLEHVVKIESTILAPNHLSRLRALARCYRENAENEKASEIENAIDNGEEQEEN